MNSNLPQVVLLAEDKQQQSFLRRLLLSWGFPSHKPRLLPVPAGKMAGEQYVRVNFPKEVRELRRKRGQVARRLVVATDADRLAVEDRRRTLLEELARQSLDPPQPGEGILLLFPKRNIETWIYYLMGNPANEIDSYPRLKARQRACQPAVERLMDLLRSTEPLPDACPPSLQLAIHDLKIFK
jgi:hypothetical protein